MSNPQQVEQSQSSGSALRWREGLAALGVIASLLFLTLEVRQNTLAVRATALNELSTATQQFLLTVACEPELADVMMRWATEDAALSEAENFRVSMAIMAFLRSLENVFIQGSIGVIDAQSAAGYGLTNQPLFTSPRFAELWRNNSNRLHPEFVAEMERLHRFSEQR